MSSNDLPPALAVKGLRKHFGRPAVDDLDRRATRARLTDRGGDVRTSILTHRRAALREVAAMLAEPDRLDLTSGLRAIAAELERFA